MTFRAIWLRPVHTRHGLKTERVEVTVISTDGTWATVELRSGERRAVEVSCLRPHKD